MKKKVGVITYHNSDNFGSVLQAYALAKYLNNSNVDCSIIDYYKTEVKNLYKIFKPFSNKSNIASNFYNFLHFFELNKRKHRFNQFRKEFLPLTKIKYLNNSQLKDLEEFDLYICGSDQVWNTNIVDFDTSYLLDFAPDKAIKISFSASVGPKEIAFDDFQEYLPLLNRLDAISIREENSLEPLEKYLNKKPITTIDPVFLLSKEQWRDLANSSTCDIKEKYILCYFPGGVSAQMESFSNDLAEKTGYKRILIMNEWKNFFRKGTNAYSTGPCDFLKLIQNAEVVCTTSFHGTAFSIIFNKTFYSEVASQNSRILNLLKCCNKTDYIINKENVLSDNLSNATGSLENRIFESKKFLNDFIY